MTWRDRMQRGVARFSMTWRGRDGERTTGRSIVADLDSLYQNLEKRERRAGRKLALMVLVILLLSAAVTAALAYRPAMLRYDLYKMRQFAEYAEHPLLSVQERESFEKLYEQRRAKLVKQGYLQHRQYTFEHLKMTPQTSNAFWDAKQRWFPHDIHAELATPELGKPQVFFVWDRPGRLDRWDEFVQEVDQPDFGKDVGSTIAR